MRQVCLELWIENKSPVLLCVKLFMLLLMVIGGVLIKGYPYLVLGVFLMLSLESTSAKLDSHVEYLVPRTNAEKKRITIVKSILVASVYSLANTAGYVLMICFYTPYQWDSETIFFIVMMTVFIFLLYFNFRMEIARMFTRNDDAKSEQSVWKRSEVWRSGACSLLAVLYILLFIFRKFAHLSLPVLSGEKQCIISAVIAIFVFGMYCYGTKKECSGFDDQEYCG